MTSSCAVRVEGLGKRYLIAGSDARAPFWALRDVQCEVERGEVLGIIGRNGAGKSTLLKILSGIVIPTTGRAELIGRVGSLLEIGTGFHPDLSGRENILLAAALLGIRKAEVLRDFDQIVEYAGIGSFIDVPVKRYSSGMYMRLAYSVTSLLRSDILLLDEVLAVGDAEFQSKTRRNVDSIAHGGRTVLFVSHSMASIKSICTRCIWLDRGRIIRDGSADQITNLYLETLAKPGGDGTAPLDIADAPPRVDVSSLEGYDTAVRNEPVIRWVETLRADGTPSRLFNTGDTLRIRIGFEHRLKRSDYFCVAFYTMDDRRLAAAYSHGRGGVLSFPDQGVAECCIHDLRLVSGDYAVILEAGTTAGGVAEPFDSVSDATRLRVSLGEYLGHPGLVRNQGYIAQRTRWHDRTDRGAVSVTA